MPIHLTSRRQFVAQLGAAMALSKSTASAAEVDESLIAILNETRRLQPLCKTDPTFEARWHTDSPHPG